MAIDNSITFGGVNSADFGIYISGEGAFDAPKRDVEMVAIPGRNGEFALDKGRFENIEVTYPAFNREEDLDTFAERLSDFRNAIASQVGYQRLTDTFHPDEYRMATFVDGLEIKPIKYNTAAQFDIVFNCKPQRYLTSGETAISVDSGDTLTNPTRFASSPLLEVEGYGEIDLGSGTVVIHNDPIGEIIVLGAATFTAASTKAITFDDTYANAGDTITLSSARFATQFGSNPEQFENITTTASGDIDSYEVDIASKSRLHFRHYMTSKRFAYGTPQTLTGATTMAWTYGGVSKQIVVNMSAAYDGANGITFTHTATLATGTSEILGANYPILALEDIKLDSSQYAVGNPLYIDLDLGEAYKIESGSVASVNNAVEMPAELPKLEPGANTITFDNTITDLKVVPRWWRI